MNNNKTMSQAVKQLNNKIKARRNTTIKNNVPPNNNTGVSRQTIVTILAVLLVIIVLGVSGRWLWNYYKDEQAVKVNTLTLLDGANSGDNEFTVSSNNMPPSTFSNEYALSFWVYVDDYNYRRDQDKYILRRGKFPTDEENTINPEIRLHPFHNTLEVALSLQTSKSPSRVEHHPECKTAASNPESFINAPKQVHPSRPLGESYFDTMDGVQLLPNPSYGKEKGLKLARLHQEHSERFENNAEEEATAEGEEESKCECTCEAKNNSNGLSPMSREEWHKTAAKCQVPDFPLQKWVHVVVSQYNQVMDLYVDGLLASSCPLPGFPAISTANMVLCPDGGFSGKIARVTYSNTSLSADEVNAIYSKGPDSNYKPIKDSVPMWAVVMVVIAIVLLVVLFMV